MVGSFHDSTQPNEGSWLPILEYAVKNGISLSTLRRYIKANKVIYRKEEGRYLIWDVQKTTTGMPLLQAQEANRGELSQLERELQDAREQITELKMLVAIYEEKLQDH